MIPLAIVHVTNSLRADGTGITNLLVDLAIAQAQRGHRVTIVCDGADGTMRALAADHGVAVVEGAVADSWIHLLRSALRISKRVGAADVVHVHTVRAALLSLLAAPLRHLAASVATVHNPYKRSSLGMYTVARVVSLSRVDEVSIRRQSLRIRHPTVVHNAILGSLRVPDLSAVDRVALPPRSVVFVGALTERKGVDVLLRAMRAVREVAPGARLFVVGNRDNPSIEALSSRLGLDDVVTFVGFERDPRRYLLEASVFVLPARADGYPLALLEARACGVPIVASRVGGIPEALSDGVAGLLVEPGDEHVLAAAVVSVITQPSLAARLREASREDLAAMTVQRMADEYDTVYATLRPRADRSAR